MIESEMPGGPRKSYRASTRRVMLCCLLALSFLAVATAGNQSQAVEITKPPDQGPFWQPLSPNGGTYVYANSFVSPASGLVSSLRTWLTDEIFGPPGNGGTDVRFEVYGSVGGNPANGPDTTSVFSTTGTLAGLGIGPLSLYGATPLPGGTPLVAGNTYWFGASVVGEAGPGAFQIGGHTQNSVVADNGVFWWSNDPAGLNFFGISDGQNMTPEMAFSVNVVPEPSALALAGLGLSGLIAYGWRRRR